MSPRLPARFAQVSVAAIATAMLVGAADAATLSFDPPITAIPGSVPRGVAAGNLNGDGNLDVAAARGDSSGGAVVALGSGNGTFSVPTTYPTHGSSVSVAIAHLNADGNQDLVVANLAGGIVSVLLGMGGGNFAAAVDYDAGASPQEVALGDLDGDGRRG